MSDVTKETPGAGHGERSGEHAITGMRILERLVALVRDRGGSDIHLLEGERPRVRLRGDLLPVDSKEHPVVTREDILAMLENSLTADQLKQLQAKGDIDFSLAFQEASGRVNVGLTNGRRLYLVMRYLRTSIVPIDELGIDAEMLKQIAAIESGLVIVSGETSSGKTTTIASMLDYINRTRHGAITTIENPVEYQLHSDKCLVTQREVGRDTPDFHLALRATVRKNPDVLLIGEIRDEETASIAMTAAETGIQTFCTLHAVGAIAAVLRLGNIMQAGGHKETDFLQRLSTTLRAIISQQLYKAADGKTVLPIYEILNVGYPEQNYLRDGDYTRLEQSLESDRSLSLGECVYRLWHEQPRRITEETIHRVFGDQFHLVMNRLEDASGWKSLVSGI